MEFTREELFTIATVMGKEVENLEQEASKVQYFFLKGVITEKEEEKVYKLYVDRIEEISKLKQKALNAAYE